MLRPETAVPSDDKTINESSYEPAERSERENRERKESEVKTSKKQAERVARTMKPR